jgi:hypothetical protein
MAWHCSAGRHRVRRAGKRGRRIGLAGGGHAPIVEPIKVRSRGAAGSHPTAPHINVAGQRYFDFHREHDSDTPFVSDLQRDAANADWHIHFTRRINDAAGRFAGIVIVETDPGYFTSGYERTRMGERGVLGIFGGDGRFRAMRKASVSAGARWATWRRSSALFCQAPVRGTACSAIPACAGCTALASVPWSRSTDEQMAAFEKQRRKQPWDIYGMLLTLLSLQSRKWPALQ